MKIKKLLIFTYLIIVSSLQELSEYYKEMKRILDDAETDGEDHILDETRYMVLFSTTTAEQRRYTLG